MAFTNNRIFWAIQAVGVASLGKVTYTAIHGLQSVGITTSFNLEQIFEIGQISIYENIEDIPDVEVTLEKVIDGYPLIYHLCTRGYEANTLTGRSNQRSSVALSIFGDVQDSASGVPITQVTMSGMYVSSLSFTFPVEGSCTEAVTLVGNNKVWDNSAPHDFTGTIFDNTDVPLAATSGVGGVQRRENIVFAVPAADVSLDANGHVVTNRATILPSDIEGVSSSGTVNTDSDGNHLAHIQNLTVSSDFGRDNLTELGQRGPYFRFINFPTEVTCEVEVISIKGDQVDALENAESNLTNRSIRIYLEEGLEINLGTSNKLANVTYGGGDAGGGNASVTYSYTTFNDFIVVHPADPVVI